MDKPANKPFNLLAYCKKIDREIANMGKCVLPAYDLAVEAKLIKSPNEYKAKKKNIALNLSNLLKRIEHELIEMGNDDVSTKFDRENDLLVIGRSDEITKIALETDDSDLQKRFEQEEKRRKAILKTKELFGTVFTALQVLNEQKARLNEVTLEEVIGEANKLVNDVIFAEYTNRETSKTDTKLGAVVKQIIDALSR